MDESKPKAGQPDERPEALGDGCASQNTEGDFTMEELLRAYQQNLDAERPPVGLPSPGRRDR
jgi:hypothetical protein